MNGNKASGPLVIMSPARTKGDLGVLEGAAIMGLGIGGYCRPGGLMPDDSRHPELVSTYNLTEVIQDMPYQTLWKCVAESQGVLMIGEREVELTEVFRVHSRAWMMIGADGQEMEKVAEWIRDSQIRVLCVVGRCTESEGVGVIAGLAVELEENL